MNSARRYAAALLLTIAAGSALADESLAPPGARKLNAGNAKSIGSSFGNQFVIEAGDADAKATLSLSDFFAFNDSQTTRYNLKVTAPFDRKKSDSVDLGSLSGLTAGTSASLELTWVDWPDASESRHSAREQVCRDFIDQAIPGYTWENFGAFGNMGCQPEDLTPKAMKEAVKTVNAERNKCLDRMQKLSDWQTKNPGRDPTADVAISEPERVICAERTRLPPATLQVVDSADLMAQLLEQRIDALATPVKLWTVGLSANKNNYSYVLPATPTAVVKKELKGWGVSAAFTYMHKAALWSLGYSHEQSYKAADKADICNPIGTTGSLSCSEASLGAPKKQNAEIAFVELRRIVGGGRMALSPRVEYDFEESEWAATVPMYLVRNKKGALTAGLSLGYTSAEDDVGLSVFVGKEFSFLD